MVRVQADQGRSVLRRLALFDLRIARLAVLVGCCVVVSGCAALTTLGGKPAGFRPLAERPRSATGLLDLRGVVHCHSYLSHDSTGTIEEIGAACAEVGIDFLVMTDHITPYSVPRGKKGMVGATLFLTGAEIRVPGGTLLAFPLKHYVRPKKTLQAYLDDIHRQGGLAFVGHAERFQRWDHPGIDGIEIHNMHAAATAAPKAEMILKTLFTPLSRLFTSLVVPDRAVFAEWDGVNRRQPVPIVGGNDAHANIRLLGPAGWVIGDYDEVFRVMTTHVLAARLDQDSVVEALRRGRTYVSFDLFWDGSGFAFYAKDADRIAEMGETVAATAVLHVAVPAAAEIRLIRDGAVIARVNGKTLEHHRPAPGVYRVEVFLDDDLWICSSSIVVQ